DYGATVNVTGSSVSGNSASLGGGGIANFGTMTIAHSTIDHNSASDPGGGIFNEVGTLTITDSSLSHNTGGELVNHGGTVTVTRRGTHGGGRDRHVSHHLSHTQHAREPVGHARAKGVRIVRTTVRD